LRSRSKVMVYSILSWSRYSALPVFRQSAGRSLCSDRPFCREPIVLAAINEDRRTGPVLAFWRSERANDGQVNAMQKLIEFYEMVSLNDAVLRGDAFGGDHGAARGYAEPRGQSGARSGAFSGFGHGGEERSFSSRGSASFGGGGGFHGGGGHR
jgi:hypothetical protein